MANVLPDGGRGTGVNPHGSDFPFVRPSEDVRHILSDAYLAHGLRTALPPLRVTRMAGFGAAFVGQDARCDLEVRDAAGAVVFDSAAATRYRATPFGPRLKIHEWYSDAAVCRVVQHTAFGEQALVRAIPADFAPQDGTLDERVSEVMPDRVLLIRDPEVGTTVDGDLVFANGYNTVMEVEEVKRGLRVITQVTWAAEPGTGLGRYPGCVEPELVVRSFNKIIPAPDGDFQLGAEGCYWVRQPTEVVGWPRKSVPVPATLHIGNDCGPCCECEDFVRVQKGILRTWAKYRGVAKDAGATRDVFRDVVDRWQEEKACVEAKVVSLALAPFGGEFIELVAGICNHTRYCLYDTTLTISIESSPGPASIPSGATQISVPGKGMVPYDLAGAFPTFSAYFDAIQAMTNGALRTRLKIPKAAKGSTVTIRVSASTASPLKGLQLPQDVVQTVTFGA